MKALLAGLPDYWLNFGLHTLLVSLLAWLACRLIRDPGRRAFFAAVGIAGIVLLPWVSAKRPFEKFLPPTVTATSQVSGSDFSGWTIRLENAGLPAPTDLEVIKPLGAQQVERTDWIGILGWLWMVGAVAGVALIVFRQWGLMKWRKDHRRIADHELDLIRGVGIDSRKLRISAHAGTPCVIGFFKPLVVIPDFLFEEGMKEKLSWALCHELEHHRSGDSRIAVMLSIAKAGMWWNPFVHSLCNIWSEDRERVCDARAMDGRTDHRAYGSFLLDLSEREPMSPNGVVSMATPAQRMKKRLKDILGGRRVKEKSLPFQIASALLMIGSVGIISFTGIRKTSAAEVLPPVVQVPVSEPPQPVEPSLPSPARDEADPSQTPEPAPAKTPGRRPFQVLITAKFLDTAQDIPEAGSILNDEEVQILMRRISQAVGSNLVTAPSVTARNGQKASIEIIRTNPEKTGEVAPGETRSVPFVGLSMESQSEVVGEKIRLSLDCLFHFEGATDFTELNKSPSGWPAPRKDFDWSKVRAVKARDAKVLNSGETMVLAFEGEDEGRHLTGFFNATKIDAKGRALDDKGNVMVAPNPEWHGKSVRMSAAIVDVPADGKLGPYWLKMGEGAAKPWSYEFLYPASHFPVLLAEARKRRADRVTELGTSIVSADSPAKIWPGYGAEIGIGFTGTQILQLRMLLPEIGEIRTWGYVGFLTGGEIAPDANGKRRWLLLSMEDPSP